MPWWNNPRTSHVTKARSQARRESRAPQGVQGIFNALNDNRISVSQAQAQLRRKGVPEKEVRRLKGWVPQ